ncbi:MAG: tRNA pseudouridine(55) synthase TruB [Bacilli bacterium]
MNGILVIDKEKNYTSRDIVNIVGKKLGTKKIGHTGTLDPLATGVLVLCIGSATKLVEIITCDDKEYLAEITLGIKTDTLDITGNIIEECNVNIEKKTLIEALNKMKGVYFQEVPIYSAVKINGKKLYQYARNKEDVILPKKEIEIKNIELINEIRYINNKTIFDIKCTVSKGTYIRSLARDIAISLNTIGIMSNLRRTRQGNFNIENANTLKDIENNNYKLIKIEDCLNTFKTIIVDAYLEYKILNGQRLINVYNSKEVLFKNESNILLALYKVYDKDETLLKPWKMFKGGNL